MMSITMAGTVYKLDREKLWLGPEPIKGILNSFSKIVLADWETSHGDKMVRVFEAVVEEFKPDSSVDIDDSGEDQDVPEGAVY